MPQGLECPGIGPALTSRLRPKPRRAFFYLKLHLGNILQKKLESVIDQIEQNNKIVLKKKKG